MRRLFVSLAVFSFWFALLSPARAAVTQMPGWPQEVTGNVTFGETCGLVLANVDADPDLEVIVATAGQQLHVWKLDGAKVFTAALTGLAQTVPAVGDVNGDGDPEIVVATRDASGGSPTPTVYVFAGDGTKLAQKALPHGGASNSPPTLADLDGDGALEILVDERGSSTGWLHAWDGDLNSIGGSWPVVLDHVPATSAAVGDIDGVAGLEVAICSYSSLWVVDADGIAQANFPRTIAGEGYSYGSPALADLDGDGRLEIVTTTHGDFNRVHVTTADGAELAGWPYDLGDAWTFAPPAVGDIDGDGGLEVVAGRSGGTIADDNLFVIRADGTDFAPFPYRMTGGAEGSYVLADITGDDRLEILFTNNLLDDNQGYLFAVDADAQPLAGWPLRPAGFTYLNGATLADVNGDGVPEIGAVGSANGVESVNLYRSPDYTFGPGGVHWRTYQADDRHSGLYHPVYPGDDDDDDTTGDDDDDDNDDNDDATDDDATDDDATDDDTSGDDDSTGNGTGDDDNDDDSSGGCGF
ncbi:MAG: VCBS repeat-containing protein [Myxococcales bacterium]|nr:VCBS repeat-containing protein [Myxococcales bacterium]